MKYKNYRNPYTNDNRIYSKKDLYEMPFGEFIRRKNEVLSQFRVLGVPTEKELQGSENVVHVSAYTRDDGTEVKAHYRCKPGGGSISSHPTEQKPKTENEKNDKQGSPIDTNSEKKEAEKEQDNNQTEASQSSEKADEQEKDERLYPKEIAGVPRGKEMSFEEADGGKVNPNIYSQDDIGNDYYNNCQSCVATYEARRRGYDVEAAPIMNGSKAQELSNTVFDAWIEPETGDVCEYGTEIDVIGGEDCYKSLDENIKQGERYQLTNGYIRDFEGKKDFVAHTMIVEKDDRGNLMIYDSQDGGIRKGSALRGYINRWMSKDADVNPQYLRIDNKIFNPYYINDIVVPRKKK